jgi:nitrite reductase/ring-hydroxylating ferredoxin subunit
MNSDKHRENNPMDAWDNEGIGVYVTTDGKVYAAQNFCKFSLPFRGSIPTRPHQFQLGRR